MDNSLQILHGDCLEVLKRLPDEMVHCCVTSPPYWNLRDYGVKGQLGLEPTPQEYVLKMVEVFREVRRVLRKDGTLWLNLGDTYASDQKGGEKSRPGDISFTNKGSVQLPILRINHGLKPKDLCGIPWRVAFALQADGWYLRQDIIWHKPATMPESVTDRCTKAHEYIFLLSKASRYFFDGEAIRQAQAPSSFIRAKYGWQGKTDDKSNGARTSSTFKRLATTGEPMSTIPSDGMRNKRSVWIVSSLGYDEAHFATYPPDLIKPCILAGTSSKGCCSRCFAPWQRIVVKRGGSIGQGAWVDHSKDKTNGKVQNESAAKEFSRDGTYTRETVGWKTTCSCQEEKTVPCTVLDPFGGSGTTGQVARELGRKAILIELNPEYIPLIKNRCDITPGLPLAC